MSRNAESRFTYNPTSIDVQRSTFDRPFNVKTSFNVGEVVPFYIDEVLPGDTHKLRTNKVVRLSTLRTPIMDNIFLDTYYFFVPNRILWDHWRELNGENTSSPWTQTIEYETPQIVAPEGGWSVGTIADYFGIPTQIPNISINALPFRAYSLIINDWFRDENLQDPANWSKNDVTITGSNGNNYITDLVKGGKPFIAAKYHDYFTSALPSPQKGPDVPLPLGASAPVYAGYDQQSPLTKEPIRFKTVDGSNMAIGTHNLGVFTQTLGDKGRTVIDHAGITPTQAADVYPANLYADLALATGTSINQLRLAFQLQKLYEKDARGGTRYIEILKSHFGVTSPDARLQRPEYLGGNRVPVTINQVVQSSETSKTPQGNTAAYSLTVDSNFDFTKSFTEHGFIIGLMVARYKHSYQQGLERFWSRKSRFDYYWPVLANIGEQAIKNKEIYCTGSDSDDGVFGYQEAWAEYRYKPNKITGEMRSSYQTSLDVWHLADDYNALPVLSSDWIREDYHTVDRVLSVTSALSNQLIADILIEDSATRPMPLYSVPGLIDHH